MKQKGPDGPFLLSVHLSPMSQFHSLTLEEVRRETEDTVSLKFNVPEALEETFRFAHGQYLTLRAILDQEDTRRSYSICSGTAEGELRVAIKEVPGGLFSTYANRSLKAGDGVEVMAPNGRFTAPLDPELEKHYVLFAAGSGITPMMSIIKTVLVREPKSRVTLIYGNRQFKSIIFREELEDLKDAYLGRMRLFHVLSREANEVGLFAGRIDAEKCRDFFKVLLDASDVDHAFICGPEGMIFAVRDTLQELGVPEDRIHFELFTSPKGKLTARPETPDSGGTGVKAAVTLYGQQWDFEMGSDETVLDAASRAGLDLPFSCKGGMCCTCRAKVTEGAVDMAVNYALYPDEVEQGFVLTCQAYPTTAEVAVDFDQQ